MRRLSGTAAILALAVLPIACGEDEQAAKDKKAPPAGLGRLAEPKGDGPDATVLRVWRYVQLGNLPLAIPQYDPRVVRSLGASNMMGALGDQRNSLAVVTPSVVERERTQDGMLLVVHAKAKGRAVGRYSFLVGRNGGSWRIRYDTLLADVLGTYVQTRVQRDINASAKRPSREATAAGGKASDDYRGVFSPRPLTGAGPEG